VGGGGVGLGGVGEGGVGLGGVGLGGVGEGPPELSFKTKRPPGMELTMMLPLAKKG